MSEEVNTPVLQNNQPEGVPSLALTGERTLPDVPEENYWFQRHLFVYQWIAEQCAGRRVVDLACGEGYGTDLIAGVAAEVVGVDANPEAFEHARARYTSNNISFKRDLIESFNHGAPYDSVVFLQTIEHIENEGGTLEHFKSILAPGGVCYISTPNLLTLAPKGAEKSDNPWHLREYRVEEFEALLSDHFTEVEIVGVFHSGKLAVHEFALKLGWERLHKTAGVTDAVYSRFIPSLTTSDFRFKKSGLEKALDFVAVCRA